MEIFSRCSEPDSALRRVKLRQRDWSSLKTERPAI